MQVIVIRLHHQLLNGSTTSIDGNADLLMGGGGSGTARSRDWDEEW